MTSPRLKRSLLGRHPPAPTIAQLRMLVFRVTINATTDVSLSAGDANERQNAPLQHPFFYELLTNLANPKALVYFGGIFSTFVTPDANANVRVLLFVLMTAEALLVHVRRAPLRLWPGTRSLSTLFQDYRRTDGRTFRPLCRGTPFVRLARLKYRLSNAAVASTVDVSAWTSSPPYLWTTHPLSSVY